MTLTTETVQTTARLQFRRAVYVYDRSAVGVSWDIDGDTLYQVYPAEAPPGYLQTCTRTMVPVEVQAALRRDFPALRRLAEIAEADQPGAPIEHPHIHWMRRHMRLLLGLVLTQSLVIVGLLTALADQGA